MLFNDLLHENTQSAPPVPSPEKEENGGVEDSSSSDGESEKTVVDYESYRRVCEDYRKTTAALKERENEVANLIKELEAKSLTIKLLKDQLLSYGSTGENQSGSSLDLRKVVEQQKEVINSLLNTDGKKSDVEKVAVVSRV